MSIETLLRRIEVIVGERGFDIYIERNYSSAMGFCYSVHVDDLLFHAPTLKGALIQALEVIEPGQ